MQFSRAKPSLGCPRAPSPDPAQPSRSAIPTASPPSPRRGSPFTCRRVTAWAQMQQPPRTRPSATPAQIPRRSSKRCLGKRALLRALLQNLLGKIVAYPGFIQQHLKVRILQQLLVVLVKQLVDSLPHARIVQIPLPGGIARNQLVDCVAGDLVPWCLSRRSAAGR